MANAQATRAIKSFQLHRVRFSGDYGRARTDSLSHWPSGPVARDFFYVEGVSPIWNNGRASRLAYMGAFSLIGWPCLGTWLFVLASLVIPMVRLRKFWLVPLSTLVLVPLSLLVLFNINLQL